MKIGKVLIIYYNTTIQKYKSVAQLSVAPGSEDCKPLNSLTLFDLKKITNTIRKNTRTYLARKKGKRTITAMTPITNSPANVPRTAPRIKVKLPVGSAILT